jgi:hypothetical protein
VSQWRQFFQDAGLVIETEEILPKPMHFTSWAQRMGVGDVVVETLRQQLFEAPQFPRTYLRPRMEEYEPYFDLTEGLFIARK